MLSSEEYQILYLFCHYLSITLATSVVGEYVYPSRTRDFPCIVTVILELEQAVWITKSMIFFLSINEPPYDKTNKMTVRPAKDHISLGICPV